MICRRPATLIVALGLLLVVGATKPAASQPDVAPPPPLIDYPPTVRQALHHVYTCVGDRRVEITVTAEGRDRIRVAEYISGGRSMSAEELVEWNRVLEQIHTLGSVHVQCDAEDDHVSINGLARTTAGPRRVVAAVRLGVLERPVRSY